MSSRPTPHPFPVELEPSKKELKGILKNIRNIAELEKSVANMYSQIDKKQQPLKKKTQKPQIPEESEVGLGVDCTQETEKNNNPSMSTMVDDLEKSSLSQSTIL